MKYLNVMKNIKQITNNENKNRETLYELIKKTSKLFYEITS